MKSSEGTGFASSRLGTVPSLKMAFTRHNKTFQANTNELVLTAKLSAHYLVGYSQSPPLLPGDRLDVHAFRFHRLEQFLDESTLADKGYIGLGLLTPVKHRSGVRMRAAMKKNNRLCSVVKRIIAQVKTWRVSHTGFRRPLSSYGWVFEVMLGFMPLEGVTNSPRFFP